MSEPVLFLHPNLIDDATVDGGNWDSSQPLSRIQDRIIGKRARSNSLSTSDTRMEITLSSGSNIKGVALVGHNIRPDAKWRVEAYSDSNFTTQVHDSGFIYAWQSQDDTDKFWYENGYETARPQREDVNDINWPLIYTILSGIDEVYWKITIDDSSNLDGYVEVGRVFIGFGCQASATFADGQTFAWNDDSVVEQSFSGVEFFRNRQPYRQIQGTINFLKGDEAYGRAQELLRLAKRTQEVFVVPQPDDSNQLNRRSFLARMTDLPALERQLPDFGNQSFNLKELR